VSIAPFSIEKIIQFGMTKKCACSKPALNFDGTCLACKKLLDWDNPEIENLQAENVIPEEGSVDSVASKLLTRPNQKIDLPTQLGNAANEVIRFSKIFKSIGDTLNVLNYIFVGLMILALILLAALDAASGLVFLSGLMLILVVWVISWIQTALLRGLASFFLMRGLRELKDLQGR
jgi:hypothetical protein